MTEVFGIDLEADNAHFVFTGDAPNDSPMFGFFENSIGVANVLDFQDRLDAEPTFITTRRGGEGFAEVVSSLLDAYA